MEKYIVEILDSQHGRTVGIVKGADTAVKRQIPQ